MQKFKNFEHTTNKKPDSVRVYPDACQCESIHFGYRQNSKLIHCHVGKYLVGIDIQVN